MCLLIQLLLYFSFSHPLLIVSLPLYPITPFLLNCETNKWLKRLKLGHFTSFVLIYVNSDIFLRGKMYIIKEYFVSLQKYFL